MEWYLEGKKDGVVATAGWSHQSSSLVAGSGSG